MNPQSITESILPALRVFISSTMKDMKTERDAVARALENLDLSVLRAEAFGSQSASTYEASLSMAQACDIYLGIYGGRYGSIVPGGDRSITETEYHTARRLNKPILIYRKTDVDVEPAQDEFLTFVGDMKTGHTWREFSTADVPERLREWVQHDVRAEFARQKANHPEWLQRTPARQRVLLASLGHSPGAVTGLYHALVRAGKRPTEVTTFSTTDRHSRSAADICRSTFENLGVPYANHKIDVEDIGDDGDAREFKGVFEGLLQAAGARDADILVGITGGRTVMGVLMGIVVQTSSVERIQLYHVDVDEDLEEDGRLPELWHHEYTPRWDEVLNPPAGKMRLVQVRFVRFTPDRRESPAD